MCKYKNKHKKSTTISKCDIQHSKQYYADHFHLTQEQSNDDDKWHSIPYCITRQEYDTAHTLFTFDKVKQAVQTTNAH